MVFGSVIKSLQSVNKYLAKGFALEIPTTSEQRSNNALHCLGIRKIC